MRGKRFALQLLVVFILLSCSLGMTSYAKVNKKKIVSEYENYVKRYRGKSSYPETEKYFIMDFNKDNNPELIVTYVLGLRYRCMLFTFSKNKVKKILDHTSCTGLRYKNGKIYVYYSYGAASGEAFVYKLQKDRLKRIEHYRSDGITERDTKFYYNDSRVKKKTYYKKLFKHNNWKDIMPESVGMPIP